MNSIAILILSLLAIVQLVAMYVQHNQAKVHLLSIRNFVMLGFVVFQLYSAIVWLVNPETTVTVNLIRPTATVVEFTAMSAVFVLVVFWIYRYGTVVDRLVPAPRSRDAEMGNGQLLFVAFVLTVVGVTVNLLPPLGLVSLVITKVGQALAAASVGLLAWAWARRPGNLILLALLVATFGIHALTFLDQFSRRPMLGLGLAGIWAIYYARLYVLPARRIVTAGAILAVPVLCALIALSAIRYDNPDSIGEAVTMVQEADWQFGLQKTLTPQNAGPMSLWIIDRYPEQHSYRHLFTLRWIVIMYVPREWWPEKPDGFGIILPYMLGYHDWDTLNLGVGIIGHAAGEGGWYALLIYSVLIGLAMRWMDLVIATPHRSPMTIVLLGSTLGHIVALTRGEAGFFINSSVMGIVGTAIVAYPTLRLARLLFPSDAPALPSSPDHSADLGRHATVGGGGG